MQSGKESCWTSQTPFEEYGGAFPGVLGYAKLFTHQEMVPRTLIVVS